MNRSASSGAGLRRFVVFTFLPALRGKFVLALQRVPAEFPTEGVGSFLVPKGDESEESCAQLVLGVKVAMSQALTVHDAEEQLHLVDPRRVLGRVVEDKALIIAAVELQPALRWTVEVDVEVVPDDVNGSLGVLSGDLAHEAHQVLALTCLAASRHDPRSRSAFRAACIPILDGGSLAAFQGPSDRGSGVP